MQTIYSTLAILAFSIATAFFDEEERHAELMLSSKDAMPKAALLRQQQALNASVTSIREIEKSGREEDSAEDEFTEDIEEDVVIGFSRSRGMHSLATSHSARPCGSIDCFSITFACLLLPQLDREALKRQARSIVDKGAKKKKLAKKRRPRTHEGSVDKKTI